MQNVRANVKVLEFKSFCIFSCILSLLIILIKHRTTKAHDRRASGDCGTSGIIVTRYLVDDVIKSQKKYYYKCIILKLRCNSEYLCTYYPGDATNHDNYTFSLCPDFDVVHLSYLQARCQNFIQKTEICWKGRNSLYQDRFPMYEM